MVKHTQHYGATALKAARARTGAVAEPLGQATASDPSGVKLLLNPQEAAQALGVNRSTLYDLMRRDATFPHFSIGRRRVIPMTALEAWVQRQLAS